MLIAFGGKNCWAFKDWMEVSLRVKKSAPSEATFRDKRVLPVVCFEGGNASGKSCGLRVLSFIVDFCRNSFNYDIDSKILVDTFFQSTEPAQFYITFCFNDDLSKEYTYEVKLTRDRVLSELLYCKCGKDKTVLFRRNKERVSIDEISHSETNIIYKPTASFISTMIQYGVKEIVPFKDFFSAFNSNVIYYGTFEDQLSDYSAKVYFDYPELYKKVVEQLRRWDTGIKDVEVMAGSSASGDKTFVSVFHHYANAEKDTLPFQAQSNGTKLLYNRLKDVFITLENGGVLIFDELGNHLHTRVVEKLVEFFLDERTNPNKAQLIFASHDTGMLNFLDKYNTYLFKKINGESICYRIDELSIKGNTKNKNLQQMYKEGLLGGYPDVEN